MVLNRPHSGLREWPLTSHTSTPDPLAAARYSWDGDDGCDKVEAIGWKARDVIPCPPPPTSILPRARDPAVEEKDENARLSDEEA